MVPAADELGRVLMGFHGGLRRFHGVHLDFRGLNELNGEKVRHIIHWMACNWGLNRKTPLIHCRSDMWLIKTWLMTLVSSRHHLVKSELQIFALHVVLVSDDFLSYCP